MNMAAVPALAPPPPPPPPRRPLLAGDRSSVVLISFLFPEGPGVRGLLEELAVGVPWPAAPPLRLLFPSTRLSVGEGAERQTAVSRGVHSCMEPIGLHHVGGDDHLTHSGLMCALHLLLIYLYIYIM